MSKNDKNNETKILGIDFNNFGNDDNDKTMHGVSTSNDLPIIEEIKAPSSKIKELLTKRLNSLKALSNPWMQGKTNETIKELIIIKDKGVSCDFFNSAFMLNEYNKDCLSLDDSVSLLPLIEKLVGSKYESNFRCGIKMVCMLFDMYSDNIKQCKRSQKLEGKSMENYNKLIEFFGHIPLIETIQKRDLNADKNLNALLQEMKDFCNECKK